ncbi:MAG TPA: MFS transporter [Opitutaceae bacterium]|nr:MFS transporter [Opitutaceae bacterium]
MRVVTPHESTDNSRAAAESAPLSRAAWLTLIAAFLGWMFDGMEQGIFPLVARPALRELLAVDTDQQIGVWMGRLTAVFLVGAAFGGLVFGWLGDRLGRVRAMSLSILVYSAFTGACYFATSPWELAVFRFVAALGMGGEWSLGVALVMETWPGHHRPWLAGAIGAASNIGFLAIGAIGYFVPITAHSWRWVMLVGAAPAALTFFVRLFVPESQRWTAAVAQRKAHPLSEIFAAPLRGRTIMAITLAAIVMIGTWGSVQWIPLWADKLTHGTVPAAKALTQVLIASGAVVGCISGALAARRGRRAAFSVLCLGSFGTCALLFHGVSHYGAAFQVLSFLVGVFTAAFFGWLPLYLPELFPTRVRATAQGIGYNAGRILAAVGALGAGRLVEFYDGNYARMGTVITLVYLLGAAIIWLAPETKDQSLPE